MAKSKSKFSIISYVDDTDTIPACANTTKNQSEEINHTFTNIDTADKEQNNQLSAIHSNYIKHGIIVWLYSNDVDCIKVKDNLVLQLQHISSMIKTFTDINECVDFLTDVMDEKIFMIISDHSYQNLLPFINEMPQLYSIYVFNNSQEKHEHCMKELKRFKGIFTQMDEICKLIKQNVYQLIVDLTPISIISSNSSLNLDELDQSFMYTQLLKEIIIDIEYDAEKERKEFTQYCIANKDFEAEKINQFRLDYKNHSAVWWYSKEWFIYSLLNKALRTQDVETIIKIGFFIQDLHREIEKRHSEKINASKKILYRGQGLLNDDFEKLRKSEGGLFSFNNFLSTSTDRQVSLMFADSAKQNPDLIGILFQMEIDPSLSSAPFMSLDGIGNFDFEAEILFSMHTIFRIGYMNKIDDRLWEVNLILTEDNDQQLKRLTDYIRNEIAVGHGWSRLARLMLKMGKYGKAIGIFTMLSELLSEGDPDILEEIQTYLGGGIGAVEYAVGNYSAALLSFEKSINTVGKLSPHNHTMIAALYNQIGLTHRSLGSFSSALLNYEKALENQQQAFPPDVVMLAKIYNNIADTNCSLGYYQNALSYFEKALIILREILPFGHSDIATSYHNIAEVYRSLSNYPLALSNMKKALESQQKYLSQDHPDLAIGHNNVGALYQTISDFKLALVYHEKALEIQHKSLPPNHPHLVISNNNIALVYFSIGNFSSALSKLEEALYICRKSLPSNHPNLAITHNNIGVVHLAMHNYSMTMSSLKETLEIQQAALPSDHPDLVTTYNNMGEVSRLMGNFSIALSHYEKALEIGRKSLPSDHQNLAKLYINIGSTHQTLGNYSTALSYYQMALDIQKAILPSDHPDLAKTHSYIASLGFLQQDVMTTAINMENALKIQQKSFLTNHSHVNTGCNNENEVNEFMENSMATLSDLKNIGQLSQKFMTSDGSNIDINDDNADEAEEFLGAYFSMLSNLENTLRLYKKHPSLTNFLAPGVQIDTNDVNQIIDHCSTSISNLKKTFEIASSSDQQINSINHNDDENIISMNHFSSATLAFQQALQIQQKHNPPNDVSLVTNYNNLGETHYSLKYYSNALSLFEQALENLQKCVPINQQLLAKTYNNIAKALEGLTRYREAIDYAKQAVNTACSALGLNHPETQAYQNYFDQLKRKL